MQGRNMRLFIVVNGAGAYLFRNNFIILKCLMPITSLCFISFAPNPDKPEYPLIIKSSDLRLVRYLSLKH